MKRISGKKEGVELKGYSNIKIQQPYEKVELKTTREQRENGGLKDYPQTTY